ncbi:hypothetical protein J3F83DRAFT_30445 [Trichoderma novae-zelandiae]
MHRSWRAVCPYERVHTMNSSPRNMILVTDPRALRMLQGHSQEPAQGSITYLLQGMQQGRVRGHTCSMHGAADVHVRIFVGAVNAFSAISLACLYDVNVGIHPGSRSAWNARLSRRGNRRAAGQSGDQRRFELDMAIDGALSPCVSDPSDSWTLSSVMDIVRAEGWDDPEEPGCSSPGCISANEQASS